MFILFYGFIWNFLLTRLNRIRVRIFFLFRNLIRFHTEPIRRNLNVRQFPNLMFVLYSSVVSRLIVSHNSKTLSVLIFAVSNL